MFENCVQIKIKSEFLMRTILTAQEIYEKAEELFNSNRKKAITKQQLAKALDTEYRILDRWLNSGHIDKGIKVFFEGKKRRKPRKNLLLREKKTADIILRAAKKLSDNGRVRVTQKHISDETGINKATLTKYISGSIVEEEIFEYIKLNKLKKNVGKNLRKKQTSVERWTPDTKKYLTKTQIERLKQFATCDVTASQFFQFEEIAYDT